MRMNQFELFSVGHDNREFERVYLQTFPEGTNPVYKTNTEHDCSCCKNFIRNFGRVISIRNGKVMTVWDVSENVPYPYNVVAETMAYIAGATSGVKLPKNTARIHRTRRLANTTPPSKCFGVG